MDDDYQDNSGFGSLAWYQMGRWSERSSQRTREWVDHIHNPVVAKVHYDQAARLNQALAAEDRRLNNLVNVLQAQANGARADYERLRVWANERLAEAEAWKANHDVLKAKYEATEKLSTDRMDYINELSGKYCALLTAWPKDKPLPQPPSEPEF